MWFEPFELYTNIEIGCVENLNISILKKYGYDERYLGATWPWKFILNEKNNSNDIWEPQRIKISRSVDYDKIKNFYGLIMKQRVFSNPFDTLEYILERIKNKQFVITLTDSYYTPYLYKHIYMHKHANHATLPVCFNKRNKKIICLSAIPKAKVTIPLVSFVNMLGYKDKFWCSTMLLPEKMKKVDPSIIYESFINEIEFTVQNYNNNVCLLDNLPAYAKQVKDMLFNVGNSLSEEGKLCELNSILNGDEGYRIDKKAKLFIEYVNTPYFKERNPEYKRIISIIEDQNHAWRQIFVILYFAMKRNRINNSFEKTFQLLDDIVERDYRLFDLLIN